MPENEIEMLPLDECVVVVLTKPNGEVGLQEMSWQEFESLRRALEVSNV